MQDNKGAYAGTAMKLKLFHGTFTTSTCACWVFPQPILVVDLTICNLWGKYGEAMYYYCQVRTPSYMLLV